MRRTNRLSCLKVLVKNTGTRYPGRQVVQVYVSCPAGKLPKERRRLAAFQKTELLAPGESRELELRFPMEYLESLRGSSARLDSGGGNI